MTERNAGTRTLQVTGYGSMPGAVDQASISCVISSVEPTAEASSEAQSTKMTQFVELMKKLKVTEDKYRGAGYSSEPLFEHNDETKKRDFKGYKTTQNLTIAVGKSEAPKIIDGLANIVSSQKTVYSVSNQAELKEQAYQVAIRDAVQRAERRVATLGLNKAKIISCEECEGGYRGGPIVALAMIEPASDRPLPNLVGGDQDISVAVSIVFELV